MHAATSRPYLSLGELADLLSVQSWRIARLFELHVVPEPERVAGRRMIPKAMVPEVAEALRARGWLPKPSENTGSAHEQQ
jgi:hypothetical protein